MNPALAEKIILAIMDGKRYCGETFITPEIKEEAAHVMGYTLEQIDLWFSELRKVSRRMCGIHILVAKRD